MNFKFLKVFSAFLILNFTLIATGYADVKIKQVTVDGSGKTKSKAISDALLQALSQVKGIQISQKDTLKNTLTKIFTQTDYVATDNQSQNEIKAQGNSYSVSSEVSKELQKTTYGYIKTFEILNTSKDNDTYQVSLKVDIPEYSQSELEQKLKLKKIAILPFSINSGAISFGDVSDASIVESIQQGLVNQFTQSRKFRVLNRNPEDEKAYKQEAQRIVDGQTDMQNIAKFGNTTSADYILTGDVTNFRVNKKQSSYYGEDFTTYSLSATVTYRLLELATMEVKWSNTVTENLSGDASSLYIDNANGSYSQASDYLVKQLFKKMSDQVIGTAYPLTVLKALDNNIYLDQGGERVVRGSIYNIFARGNVVKDVSTGRLITLSGKKLATIKITDVMPKYSIGEVVDGKSSDIKANDKAFMDS